MPAGNIKRFPFEIRGGGTIRYYELEGTADYGFNPLVPRGERVRRPGGCVECESLPPGAPPPDQLPVRWSRTDAVLASSWGFGVIRRDLLDALLALLVHQRGAEVTALDLRDVWEAAAGRTTGGPGPLADTGSMRRL